MNLVADGGPITKDGKDGGNGLQQIDEEEADYHDEETAEGEDAGASSRGRGRGSDDSSSGENSRENS